MQWPFLASWSAEVVSPPLVPWFSVLPPLVRHCVILGNKPRIKQGMSLTTSPMSILLIFLALLQPPQHSYVKKHYLTKGLDEVSVH